MDSYGKRMNRLASHSGKQTGSHEVQDSLGKIIVWLATVAAKKCGQNPTLHKLIHAHKIQRNQDVVVKLRQFTRLNV